jgi:hypothetical protein
MSNLILGLDASTSTVGWAFAKGLHVVDAGFIRIDKIPTNKEKSKHIVSFLNSHNLITDVHHLNLEAALSGFGGGLTSQQTIITLSRWNAVLEYVIGESFKFPIALCNVNTMRKKVFGKARLPGVKSKDYVRGQVPLYVPNIKEFEKLNRNDDWDAHNADMYDAVVCALYG